MTKNHQEFIEYIREDYDINEKIDFLEETQRFSISIESNGIKTDLELIGTAIPYNEEGGEPDEFLYSLRDKNIFIHEITEYNSEGDEVTPTKVFKNAIESALNEQLYDD